MADPVQSDPVALDPDPEGPPMPDASPSLARLFLLWLLIGIQSFGGGVATLSLIRNAAVDRERWVKGDEFARYWGLVQLAPGINLLALTILLGCRAAGAAGIAVSLAGLLFPSAAITAALTALYARIAHEQIVERAVRGIIPATVGIGLVTALQIALPIFSHARREGESRLAIYIVVLATSAAVAVLFHGSVVWILLAGGALGALAEMGRRIEKTEGPAP